jgi:drug/metabolite transporter (DMT)-like permease
MPPHASPPEVTPGAALAACHVAVALFGFAGVFGKWIAWDPVAIVLGRTTVAAIVLAFFVRYRLGVWRPAHWIAVPNGVILAVHWVAFFTAIKASTVAIGLLGYASFPLFVPFLERSMLGVPIRQGKLAGAALVAVGLVLLVPEFTWQSHTVRGLAWGVLSGFMFALLTVRTRKLVPDRWPSEMALWQNAIAALCVLPVVLWQGGLGGPVDAGALGKMLLLGVLCTAVAHALYTASLARLPASTAAVCAALEPVYGMALALALLGEVPSARTMAGAAVIVVAALVASHRATRVVPSADESPPPLRSLPREEARSSARGSPSPPTS